MERMFGKVLVAFLCNHVLLKRARLADPLVLYHEYLHLSTTNLYFLAAGDGIEPPPTESKSAVLPLYEPATAFSFM